MSFEEGSTGVPPVSWNQELPETTRVGHPCSLFPAFRLNGVGKVFRIYDSSRDRLLELAGFRKRYREFTALHPLDLEIRAGVSLGIIGDNGAGKSTLLHLLAGSHQPSSGTIERHGKVLGLLELGVGFHPDFSGRENVFFYGDMLGLERAFVRSRFAEIVAFAELEEFIDQPLRTYSTGMRVRLAFALVASLDPDILIVDEALAVGDMHFQKKCIDRMFEFRRAGKTIILCSHSLYQIGMFCDEVLWIQSGQVRMQGSPDEVLPFYQAYQMAKDQVDEGGSRPPGSVPARITRFAVTTPLPLETGTDLGLAWEIEAAPSVRYHVTLSLKVSSGYGVFVTGTQLRGAPPMTGGGPCALLFPRIPLLGGEYLLHLRLWDDQGLVLYDERLIEGLVVKKQGLELGITRLACVWSSDDRS